jgi:tripeptidyl-peptidase-1
MKILPGLFGVTFGLIWVCNAAPSTQRHVLHEKRQSTSSQWLNFGPVEPDSKIVVRVGLKQSDLHKAHEYLMNV